MLRKLQKKRDEQGFTLVELMIVIAIIGILAAIALPQYAAYRNKAKAKPLIGYARACAMQAATQCQDDTSANTSSAWGGGACNVTALNGTALPSGDHLLFAASGQPAGCSNVNTTVTASIGDTTYTSKCIGNYTTNIKCKLTP